MKTISSILILLSLSGMAFSQSWGTTTPEVIGGHDVQYIPELNTTYASGGGNVITLSHDTVTSTIAGPVVNKFRYFFDTLFAATNGTNSFQYLDSAWNEVPNVSLNARSFYLDTIGTQILILSESTDPYPGHVIRYNGSQASTIPGLDVYWTSDHSTTYDGKKFITYISPNCEAHLLMWDGQSLLAADVPNNYAIANLFVTNSNLYATLILLGTLQLWKYDGSDWEYVLQFPGTFNCSGAYNDADHAIYFFGSTLYKCALPDTNLVEVESPITNTIYAMTKDTKTGLFYVSSNYIFWWNGKMSLATDLQPTPSSTPAKYKFDMSTNTLFVDYDKEWAVFNNLGQMVTQGNGKGTKNLGYLSAGIYIISPKEILWSDNKFLITR
ncbi:MAG TPA: hypothetical protein VE978_19385 [Chitinophagales bacterium]|nr:hypothetical protein [Chitinophagales bacterium]